jgi:PTS system nitrogen regulatory IIA component
MLLGEMLHAGVVKLNMEAETKFEAIEELIDLLIEAHEIPMALRHDVMEAVFAREQTMSTGMEHGIALPHGATDKVEDVIGALGIAPRGIPFESLDGLPAKLILLLLVPRRSFQGYVRTLAGIAHLFQDERFRDGLVGVPNATAAIKLIEREEEKELRHQHGYTR